MTARGLSAVGRGTRRCAVVMQHVRCQGGGGGGGGGGGQEPEVVFSDVASRGEEGRAYRQILLNRPRALNALNHSMAGLILAHLRTAASDPTVAMVIIEGAGEKAFCAGGDIRAVTEAGKTGQPLAQLFFQEEYKLNHATNVFPKPYLAIIDGITMGGGVGLSVHSPFRVATERTLFAMPETNIGLFPDVGGSFFLPHLPGQLGMFLSLTGHRLKARDVYHAGIATHYIPSPLLPQLRERLADLCPYLLTLDPQDQLQSVRDLLDSLHKESEDGQTFSLQSHTHLIDRAFSQETVEAIVETLSREGGEWGARQVDTLAKMSPTSLKVTHRQLRKGAGLSSLAECLEMEYRICQWCMTGHDFYEGVRAVLIDKDNTPHWSPSTLEEVTEEIVSRHFSPLPAGKEWKLNNI